MSPLYLHNGKLLLVEGALATNERCCCGGNGMCISPYSVTAINTVNQPFCEEGVIWYPNANKICYVCTPVGSENCPSCTVDIEFPFELPDDPLTENCNEVCTLSVLWSIFYGLSFLTSEQKTAGTIETTRSPAMTVSIDVNFINTNYPAEDGWLIAYTQESVTREERSYDCEYNSTALICRSNIADIRIFAIKDCAYEGGGALEEITDDAITGSTSSTTGAVQISDNSWYWIVLSEIDGCTYPPLFNIADNLAVECLDENYNCTTGGDPY